MIYNIQNNEKKQKLLLSLAGISFLSLAEKINLFKKLDSMEQLAIMSIEEISQLCKRKLSRVIWDGKSRILATEREYAILKSKRIKFVSYFESNYPALLRETSNAPFVLFYYGDINVLCQKTVSVVGTRHITQDGKAEASQFAKFASLDGVTVVSGLAMGVDAAAHRGSIEGYYHAVDNGMNLNEIGKTCAVLPCGCDSIVPSSNKKLAEKIINTGGCIISEYPPLVPCEKWRFVQRNRIIAGLSPATVVVQAPSGSGALITAQFAVEYNRDVVFHKACFSESAEKMSELVHRDLENSFALGKVSKSKLENTCAKYIECGAPVIKDYNDFCRFLLEKPGERHCKIKESGQLFLSI